MPAGSSGTSRDLPGTPAVVGDGRRTITVNASSPVVTPGTSNAVDKAADDLRRDIARVFTAGEAGGAPVVVVRADLPPEHYRVSVGADRLEIAGGDDLGMIYGLYAVSRSVLGVSDLWFWNDQHIEPRAHVELSADFALVRRPDAVTYKGFFLNDEVLLEDWSIAGDGDLPWEHAFETILRLGGNFVIPGTGQHDEVHVRQAHQRGLYLGQHHATPLGARMFAEVFPDEQPRWPEHSERFERLWRESIAGRSGQKVLWTLGFRGQGDIPFWENDPRYRTDTERGAVLSDVIRRQYELVQELEPGAPCCVYLYGESMELYHAGHLTFPPGLTTIWSDNGYGRMVSRRQGNSNPRIPSMPDPSSNAPQGIYYHASFYDLQAANHITGLPVDPRLVARELEAVLHNGGTSAWVVNSSNIKPHVFLLAMIAEIWREGSVDVEAFERRYAREYFGEGAVDDVVAGLEGYWRAAIAYGPNWDDRAGEQFLNHVPRTLAVQYMRDRVAASDDLRWLHHGPTLRAQIEHVRDLCEPAAERYRALAVQIETAALQLPERAGRLIRDSLLLQARIYARCARASSWLCASLVDADEGDFRRAFYHAGLACEEFAAADRELRSREHGKWHNFWRNECLTDVKQSAQVARALMGYLRALGDGPHYYQWKREFLYPERERNVMLIMNMENHETDDEIFQAMKAAWQD